MKIKEIREYLEGIAPLSYQENYDNSGLLVGNDHTECTGIIVSLDTTEAVVEEAVRKKCNLIVSHHPIIFKGIRKLNGRNYVERTIIAAIKNDIAIYAIHTNLDNVSQGVNKKIAEKLHLQNCKPLLPKTETLQKLVTFSPVENADAVRNALFKAGAGAIGKYDECSFNVEGTGTFTASEGSRPFVGEIGKNHLETEIRIEVIFPAFLQHNLVRALKEAHPYEEPAYDVYPLDNHIEDTGSGLTGELTEPVTEDKLLKLLKTAFGLSVVKHTRFSGRLISKVALCGGAGFFLFPNAIAAGAQAFITSDIKYHEFFDADNRILLTDIGHYESEQFTIELIAELLQKKYANFAIQKTEINTNPVYYYS